MMDKAVAEVVSDKDITNTAEYSPRVAGLGALVAVEARLTLHAVANLLLDPVSGFKTNVAGAVNAASE